MALAQKRRMTQKEYDRWCWTTELRTEFVDGRVIVLSPEGTVDEYLRIFLASILRAFAEVHELGKVSGPNFQIRPREGLRRVPDLLFVAREHEERIHPTFLEPAPDLAVEIVSRRSTKRDRVEKYAEYEAAGVGEYWIIEPRRRAIDAFTLEEGHYVPLSLADGILRSRVVTGFWLRVEWLWQDPMPRLVDVQRELGLV